MAYVSILLCNPQELRENPPEGAGTLAPEMAPPAGDGARWAHCRGGPQQRARGRRETGLGESEPFVFLLLGVRY